MPANRLKLRIGKLRRTVLGHFRQQTRGIVVSVYAAGVRVG